MHISNTFLQFFGSLFGIHFDKILDVKIIVHKGKYWEGDFILKQNCLIENVSSKYGLRLENIEMENI